MKCLCKQVKHILIEYKRTTISSDVVQLLAHQPLRTGAAMRPRDHFCSKQRMNNWDTLFYICVNLVIFNAALASASENPKLMA